MSSDITEPITTSTHFVNDLEIIKPRIQLRKWGAFFLLGLINNLGYVVVNSAAQSLADSFFLSNLIGAVPWANVAFGFVARGLGAVFIHYTSYSSYAWRIIVNGLFMIFGIIGVALAPSFYFALGAVCIVGLSSSFGESVLLGYLRFFKSELVNAWSSGTGGAGVCGTLLYILFGFLGLNDRQAFLVTVPTVLIYWVAFFVVLEHPKQTALSDQEREAIEESLLKDASQSIQVVSDDDVIDTRNASYSANGGSSSGSNDINQNKLTNSSSKSRDKSRDKSKGKSKSKTKNKNKNKNENKVDEQQGLLDNSGNVYNDEESGDDDEEESENQSNYLSTDNSSASIATNTTKTKTTSTSTSTSTTAGSTKTSFSNLKTEPETTLQRYWRCTKLIWWIALQLSLVYVFEYVISSGCASKVVTSEELKSSNFFYSKSYAIFGFCYQIGVFISRSSLQLFKIRRVEILTVLQGLNMVIWIIDDVYKFISIYVLFPMMIFVGLLGGASYVNVFHLALTDTSIPEPDRELCINLVALAITIGITLGCSLILIFDNTFLANV